MLTLKAALTVFFVVCTCGNVCKYCLWRSLRRIDGMHEVQEAPTRSRTIGM
ncbi:MAG: hypothetical protein FWE87_00930 [Coriobacteriia bacterium]|nr:hypothetical protein [Coriobacteriia bacterium]